jgi:hypothetical protein
MGKDVEVVFSRQSKREGVGEKMERIVQDRVDSLVSGFLRSSLLASCSAIGEGKILYYLYSLPVSF